MNFFTEITKLSKQYKGKEQKSREDIADLIEVFLQEKTQEIEIEYKDPVSQNLLLKSLLIENCVDSMQFKNKVL